MKVVGLAFITGLLLVSGALGDTPNIGDSVVVISEQANIQSKQGSMGSVPKGTRFTVRQKTRGWLLGQFTIQGQPVFGWVKPETVQVVGLDIPQQPTHDFTWHNLLLARDKIDESFSLLNHVDDYMMSMRQNVWERARYDEFELERKRTETREIIKQRLASFDVDRDFVLKTNLTFESYDFEKATFPIKEATANNYWYESADHYPDDIPSSMNVYLKDPKMISGIPMSKDAAEFFISSRKSNYGSIDRKIYANIRLRIKRARSARNLEAEVRWVQFYGDRNRTRLIYETPRSPDGSDANPPSVTVVPTVSASTTNRVVRTTNLPATLPTVQPVRRS